MTGERDFDRWLASEFTRRQEHIDDDGFSRRVSASLADEPRRSVRWHAAAVLLCALAAGGLAWTLVPWVAWVHGLISLFSGLPTLTLLQLGVGMAAVLTGAAWAAVRFERVLA